ncbi:MAG: hypothetical protein AAGH65_00190 [Pseudomonadota bacterium]
MTIASLRSTLIASILSMGAIATPLIATQSAMADEFTDTLDAASQAYAEGDIKAASEELTYASQLLQNMKADQFAQLLPEPLEGWTREVNTDATAAMGMFGGGTTATGQYSNGSERFEITMMADSPSVMSMAGMLSNPQMMASMGEIVRIQRQSFVNQNGELTGLIDGRVLIQASGSAAQDAIVAHLETIDFRGFD